MSNLEITLNPQKTIKRSDLGSMADMIKKASRDKHVDVMIITVESKDGKAAIPFKIVDKK